MHVGAELFRRRGAVGTRSDGDRAARESQLSDYGPGCTAGPENSSAAAKAYFFRFQRTAKPVAVCGVAGQTAVFLFYSIDGSGRCRFFLDRVQKWNDFLFVGNGNVESRQPAQPRKRCA